MAWVVLALVMGEWFSSLFPAVACSGYLAWTYERRRRDRLRDIAEAWPDAIRHLLSYVRSGSTIPLAVNALATQGPLPLRSAFDFAEHAKKSLRLDDKLVGPSRIVRHHFYSFVSSGLSHA